MLVSSAKDLITWTKIDDIQKELKTIWNTKTSEMDFTQKKQLNRIVPNIIEFDRLLKIPHRIKALGQKLLASSFL